MSHLASGSRWLPWLVATPLHSLPPISFAFTVSVFSSISYRTFVIGFKDHLDNTEQSTHPIFLN